MKDAKVLHHLDLFSKGDIENVYPGISDGPLETQKTFLYAALMDSLLRMVPNSSNKSSYKEGMFY